MLHASGCEEVFVGIIGSPDTTGTTQRSIQPALPLLAALGL